MAQAIKITVTVPLSGPNFNEVKWKTEKSPLLRKDPIQGFNVLFSHASSVDAQKVNSTLIDDTGYRHKVNNFNKQRRGYYIVEAVTVSGKTYQSQPIDIYHQSNILMREQIYKSVLDSAGSASPFTIPIMIYQNRHSGILCSRCGDSVELGNMQAKCPECWGTGFSGGYYTPVIGYVEQQGMTQAQGSIQVTGKDMNINKTYALSSAFALVQVGDLIRHIKSPNKLYSIASMSYSEFDVTPITQFISCAEEESGHALYLDVVPYHDRFIYPEVFLRSMESDLNAIRQLFKDTYLHLKNS